MSSCCRLAGLLVALLSLAPAAHVRADARALWLAPHAAFRRAVYIDTSWAKHDLVDFPLELRFARGNWPLDRAGSVEAVLEGSSERLPVALDRGTDGAFVVTVRIPRIPAGTAETRLQLYVGSAPGDRPVAIAAEAADTIEMRYQADRTGDLLLAPGDVSLAAGAAPELAAGLCRPAISLRGKSLLQLNVPDRMRTPADGWTFEIVARDPDPNARNHIGALLSAWPVDCSRGTLDDLRIANVALIDFVYHMATPGGWVTIHPVDTREWHSYTATIDVRAGKQRLYVDGRPVSVAPGPTSPVTIGSFCVGSWLKSDAWAWRGLVDRVRITSGLLPEERVRAAGMAFATDPRFLTIGPVETREQAAAPLAPIAGYPLGRLARYADVEFRWHRSPGIATYRLTVWRGAKQDRPVIDQTVEGATYAPPPGLIEPGVEFRWRVATVGRQPAELTSADESFSLPADPQPDVAPVHAPSLPARVVMRPADHYRIGLDGPVGRRVAAVIPNWALRYPLDNPDLIRMMREQWRSYDGASPWWGDALGKFLTGAALVLNMTDDHELAAMVHTEVAQAVSAQEADGYLGALPKGARLAGSGVMGVNWDLSNIQHMMNAFIYQYRLNGHDPVVLRSVMRLADLLCAEFGSGKSTVWEPSETAAQCNWGVLGPLVDLYRLTGRARYLDLARSIVAEWESRYPTRPEWLTLADKRKGLMDMHGLHALEIVHCFVGLADLYEATGDARLKRAVLHWWSEMRRHEEMAHGNLAPEESWRNDPYSTTWAETCVVTAYMRLSLKALGLTGNPDCADAIEKGLYNAYLGALHPSGKHWCYQVPVNGKKNWGAGARADNPDIACCFNWGMVGMGLIPLWGTMVTAGTSPALVVNYYGNGVVDTSVGARGVRVVQRTSYPADPVVRLAVRPSQPARFPVWLRIPAWSRSTQVWLNDKQLKAPRPGVYLKLEREWRQGDSIRIAFDFRPRPVLGRREAAGKAAIYRGPILLTADQRDNRGRDMNALPTIDLTRLRWLPAPPAAAGDPSWVRVSVPTIGGGTLTLRDFASAGANGGENAGPDGRDGGAFAGWIPAR